MSRHTQPTELQRYKDFKPTTFDPAGSFLDDDRQEWFVVPVSQTRDSSALDKSNFAAALGILGGEESEVVEVHRFGHWGPRWFEIIITHPSRRATVEEVAANLEDYPVLDEEDFSKRELEEFEESWKDWACKDFCKALQKFHDMDEDGYDRLREVDDAKLLELYNLNNDYGTVLISHALEKSAEDVSWRKIVQLLFEHERPEPTRSSVKKWLESLAEDMGWEIPIPSILDDDKDQQYLFDPEILQGELTILKEMTGLELCGPYLTGLEGGIK